VEQLEVTALTVYPVKSMKGIALERAVLTPAGLAHDRRFMVVGGDGRFVTQRDLPGLALIETVLEDDAVGLSLRGHGSVRISLEPAQGAPVRTHVWGDACETVDQGEEVSRWLTGALRSRQALRLVHMAPGYKRPQGNPEQLGEQTHTYFADAAPYLVANEASLDALNRELKARGHAPVPMNRFRPNVVVNGLQPFAEHAMPGLAGAGYGLRFCHPCERCVVTTIDQDTAARNPQRQPYLTLRELNPAPGTENSPAFGQNATLLGGDGRIITLGDRLSLMAGND
jgi:uncharacterized protein YcbX